MPIKYIKQIINQDFVYPNNEVSEYDQEIVHDLNENSVSGTVVTLTATTATSTGMTFSISTTWSLNSAEPFIRNSNSLSIYSVHMLAPGQNYYKPWRIVHSRSATYSGQTSFSETGATFSVKNSKVIPSPTSQLKFGCLHIEIISWQISNWSDKTSVSLVSSCSCLSRKNKLNDMVNSLPFIWLPVNE